MAAEDLKGFTMQGVTGGLLMVCLLSFAIGFMYYNNPTGLGNTASVLNSTYQSSYNNLVETPINANTLLNITSNTNPEVSDLGSRDSVATSYSATGTAKGSFETAKDLITWVFNGAAGQVLLGTLTGLIGLLAYFFIYKHIRQGN